MYATTVMHHISARLQLESQSRQNTTQKKAMPPAQHGTIHSIILTLGTRNSSLLSYKTLRMNILHRAHLHSRTINVGAPARPGRENLRRPQERLGTEMVATRALCNGLGRDQRPLQQTATVVGTGCCELLILKRRDLM